ncbi:polysaccharide biosynthesis protein, partial [Chlorogloeopsis sp. ULAP02]
MRNRHWLILDIIIFATTPLLALILRLDGIPSLEAYLPNLAFATILFLLIKQFILWSSGFYRRYWRYASIEELTYIAMLMAAAIIIQSLCFVVINDIPDSVLSGLPRSLPLIDGLLSFILIGGLRFST